MIGRISTAVGNWLAKEGAVSNDDSGLYRYAVYSLLFGLAPIMIAVIWGLLFRMLGKSLLLILPFMLIRKFSGGYHLDSPVVCTVSSTILIGLATGAVKVIETYAGFVPLTVMTVLSVICICVCSPIDSESRQLSEKEHKLFGRVAVTISVIMLAVYVLFVSTKKWNVAVPLGVGIVLPAILQLPAVVQRQLNR